MVDAIYRCHDRRSDRPESGVWVTDIDVDEGKGIDGFPLWHQLIAQYGEIPPTLTSITPRGGRHCFFTWQAGLTIKSRVVFPGIDTRSEGGYVILPPSTRSDGVGYRWDPAMGAAPIIAPPWLVALLSTYKCGSGPGRGRDTRKSPKRDLAWAQAALDAECAKIASAQPGARNAALNTGAFNVFQIVHGNPGLLDEEEVRQRLFAAAEACGLVADDGADSAWRTIESGAAGAQSQPRVRPLAQLEQPTAQASGGGLFGIGGGLAGAVTGIGAAAANGAAQAGMRRVIQLVEGDYHIAADEAEEALLFADWSDIFQRGGMLVRPVLEQLAAADDRATTAWRLTEVRLPYLLEMLERTATFTVYDRRSKAWIPRNCPYYLGNMLLARRGLWRAPVVLGIVHTPQFRLDGSLAMAPGYDPDTRLLFKPDGEVFPPVPDRPDAATTRWQRSS